MEEEDRYIEVLVVVEKEVLLLIVLDFELEVKEVLVVGREIFVEGDFGMEFVI